MTDLALTPLTILIIALVGFLLLLMTNVFSRALLKVEVILLALALLVIALLASSFNLTQPLSLLTLLFTIIILLWELLSYLAFRFFLVTPFRRDEDDDPPPSDAPPSECRPKLIVGSPLTQTKVLKGFIAQLNFTFQVTPSDSGLVETNRVDAVIHRPLRLTAQSKSAQVKTRVDIVCDEDCEIEASEVGDVEETEFVVTTYTLNQVIPNPDLKKVTIKVTMGGALIDEGASPVSVTLSGVNLVLDFPTAKAKKIIKMGTYKWKCVTG